MNPAVTGSACHNRSKFISSDQSFGLNWRERWQFVAKSLSHQIVRNRFRVCSSFFHPFPFPCRIYQPLGCLFNLNRFLQSDQSIDWCGDKQVVNIRPFFFQYNFFSIPAKLKPLDFAIEIAKSTYKCFTVADGYYKNCNKN